MPSTVPHYLAVVGLVLTASLAVLGQNVTVDPCGLQRDCKTCVVTRANETEGASNATCVWEVTGSGQVCEPTYTPGQEVHNVIISVPGCDAPPATTTPAPTTSTVAPTTTTNGTSTTTTTTSATTTTAATTTTVAPSSNGTTTTTTAPSSNGTSTTPTPGPTTPVPTNTTTAAPPPKPAPAHGGFSWASFIGGIVFAAALSSVAYLIWRFYKVRLDRNYHTFSNPSF